jgi:hemerythrin
MAWSARRMREAYACGERTIDAQHEELFRLANGLIAASLRQADDRGAFLASLEALLAHVVRHFASEEAILEARGYAKLAQHGPRTARCSSARER